MVVNRVERDVVDAKSPPPFRLEIFEKVDPLVLLAGGDGVVIGAED